VTDTRNLKYLTGLQDQKSILFIMKMHDEIDSRGLALAREIAAAIDADPERALMPPGEPVTLVRATPL